MCQCMLCQCWWCNICGVCCAGWNWSYCLCSCWICKPQDLEQINRDCCICCDWVGLGGNFLCQGSICCAPDYVKKWSVIRTTAKFGGLYPQQNNQMGGPHQGHQSYPQQGGFQQGGFPPQQGGFNQGGFPPQQGGFNQGGGQYPPQYGNNMGGGGPTRIVING